jgi:hypothetical protein
MAAAGPPGERCGYTLGCGHEISTAVPAPFLESSVVIGVAAEIHS